MASYSKKLTRREKKSQGNSREAVHENAHNFLA
jgi:hypothetical protein